MSERKRMIVRRTEQQIATVQENTCIEIHFRPAVMGIYEDDMAAKPPYKVREKVSSPPIPKAKILWGGFAGQLLTFLLRDGSMVTGRLDRRQYWAFIKLFDVVLENKNSRTKAKWMMLDGADVLRFFPADAQTEKVEE